VKNDKNIHTVADSNRMMVSMSNESNHVLNNMLKEELNNKFIEMFMMEVE
jgi:hypothetical protein